MQPPPKPSRTSQSWGAGWVLLWVFGVPLPLVALLWGLRQARLCYPELLEVGQPAPRHPC